MKPFHEWSGPELNGASGAKALLFLVLNVAAEAATHKDYL
jgi:hypothetical protein